jgi:thiamine-monophosphate kinase
MASSERQLVSFLAERFGWAAPDVQLGIGDDAAVLTPSLEPLVLSVDASVEGVHFDPEYLSYEDVGYRAFQAAMSDLAAMGAEPVAALSALVLPRHLSRQALDQLTAGQAEASRETRCPVVGGNVSRGRELSITTTVVGRAARPLQRRGARPGEQLWLIGEIGMAAAGLAHLRLQRARRARAWAAAPSSAPARQRASEAALAPCIDAWRRPRARLGQGLELVGRASAAIDISDGLAADAQHLARASGVRLVIHRERLRAALPAALLVAQAQLRRSALRLALEGGEDYALLATGPSPLRPASALVIGHIEPGRGAFLDEGDRLSALRGGFDHLKR